MANKIIPERLQSLPHNVAVFLMEIDEVCLKHGITLAVKSSKSSPPNFELRHYNRTDRNVLWEANNVMLGAAKTNQSEEVRERVVWGICRGNSENKITQYKDYCLRVEKSFGHSNFNGFIDGRLIKVNGTFDETAKVLLDAVDLLDPCDKSILTPKG